MISKEQVKHIAKLVRLRLTEKEIKKYQEQLGKILDYVSHLQKVNTKDVQVVVQKTDLKNVFREDKAETRVLEKTKKLVKQAPETQNGLIKIKGVFYEPK